MDFDPSHPNYVSLPQAIGGHLITSGLLSPVVAAVLWLGCKVSDISCGFGTAFLVGLVACLVNGVAVAIVERPYVVRSKHGAPGGAGYASWSLIIPPIVGAAVGWCESADLMVPTAISVFVVCLGEFLWLKPWIPGDSGQEVRRKWEETKDLVHEESLKDGWVVKK